MNKKNKTGMLGHAAVMGIIIFVAKILGLARDMAVSNAYGTTTTEAQAYEIAFTLPDTMFSLVIGGVITSAFIPVFNSIMVQKGKKEAFKFTSSYINFVLLISVAVLIFGMVFTPYLVNFIAPDVNAETANLAVYLSRIMFPMIIFIGLAFSFVGFLQSLGEYNIPALISAVSNIIIIIYMLTFNSIFGITGLAVAMLFGWMVQAFVQLPKVHSLGYRYSVREPIWNDSVKRAVKNAVPILIGTWTVPVCNLINTRLASNINDGSAIVVLRYANKLNLLIVGMFSFVATNLLFPYFSRAEASGDRNESSRLVKTSVKALVYIIAPIMIGVMFLAEPFTALIFERGMFTPEDTIMTATALKYYCIGMIFTAVNEVLAKALFAAEKVKIPMVSSICSMIFNVVIVTFLADWLGIGGIALASGLAAILNLIINLIMAGKLNICRLNFKDTFDIAKSVISAGLMIPAIYIIKSRFSSDIAVIALSVAAGAVIYAVCTVLLRSEQTWYLINIFRRKSEK